MTLWARHLGTILVAACALDRAALAAITGRVELYPLPPGTPVEARLEAKLNDQKLALVTRRIRHSDYREEHFMEVAVGRCAAEGPLLVSVEAKGGQLGQAVLRSVGRDWAGKRTGAGLTFELPAPGQYYLQLPGLAQSNGTFTAVFWVDDLRRLEEKRTRYQAATNIATAGIHPDAKLDQTASVQRLLDRHGEIYFPAGVYRTGTLHVGSDTTLFFAPGALLMALDADEAVGAEFIALDNTHNVKFCGPGTIDAHSTGGRRGHNVHNVNVTGSRQVEFEDVCFEGSNSWGVHVRKSEQFTARNVNWQGNEANWGGVVKGDGLVITGNR